MSRAILGPTIIGKSFAFRNQTFQRPSNIGGIPLQRGEFENGVNEVLSRTNMPIDSELQ